MVFDTICINFSWRCFILFWSNWLLVRRKKLLILFWNRESQGYNPLQSFSNCLDASFAYRYVHLSFTIADNKLPVHKAVEIIGWIKPKTALFDSIRKIKSSHFCSPNFECRKTYNQLFCWSGYINFGRFSFRSKCDIWFTGFGFSLDVLEILL